MGSLDTRIYGEPIELKGNDIYFTSWKYVRQGGFSYERSAELPSEATDPMARALYSSDGPTPAKYRSSLMPQGVRLVVQKADKVQLDGESMKPATVIQEDGRYKAWGSVMPCPEPEPFSSKESMLLTHDMHLTYAGSSDGMHWEEPSLSLYEYAGSMDNNIALRNDLEGSTRGLHGMTVFVDPTSDDERYKMVFLGNVTDEEWDAFAEKYPGELNSTARRRPMHGYRIVSALFGAVSPDGIHWENLPEPLCIDHCDTQNTCYYDLDHQTYIAYVRTWQVGPMCPAVQDNYRDTWIRSGRRSIGRTVSPGFRHFSRPELVITTGADLAPSHLWYTNCKTTLPGCPDQHVMFPWRWELECDGGDCFLFSSADGWSWSQVPGGPVVARGAPGEPDGGYIVCSPNLVELPGDRWGLPSHGCPIPHKYPGRDLSKRTGLFPGVPEFQGYAVWKKGRLVALECPDEGSFATIGMMPKGDRITLNAAIQPAGYITASVCPLDGSVVEGRSHDDCDLLLGDGLAMPVTWNGGPTSSTAARPSFCTFV